LEGFERGGITTGTFGRGGFSLCYLPERSKGKNDKDRGQDRFRRTGPLTAHRINLLGET